MTMRDDDGDPRADRVEADEVLTLVGSLPVRNRR